MRREGCLIGEGDEREEKKKKREEGRGKKEEVSVSECLWTVEASQVVNFIGQDAHGEKGRASERRRARVPEPCFSTPSYTHKHTNSHMSMLHATLAAPCLLCVVICK